jgi:hypothetical protein
LENELPMPFLRQGRAPLSGSPGEPETPGV